MCGICGFIERRHPEDAEKILRRMMDAMRERGPDESGVRVAVDARTGKTTALGHVRLSIIDLQTGRQPMSNERGDLWTIFNGEIYNFQELRDDLMKMGHRFATRSDTETILHAYEQYGEACLDRFRGMFAFALWDEQEGSLFLARDRMGQKPLVYYAGPDFFVFASQLNALVQHPRVPRDLDELALHDYLTYQYVPRPRTMFRGVKKLAPAHAMRVKGTRAGEPFSYWRVPTAAPGRMHFRDAAEAVRESVFEATRLRLISDVPLGAFLSGGIDSTVTVACMAQLMSEPVRTFSIAFEEKKYDESSYAALAARKFGTRHEHFVVRPDALEILPRLIWSFGEPFADSSAIPTYYVARMTRDHVTVALTGDAGDENFAGYPRYRAIRLSQLFFDPLPRPIQRFFAADFWQKIPASPEQKTIRRRLKRLLRGYRHSPEARYLEWIAIFNEERKRAIYTEDFLRRVQDRDSLEFLMQFYKQVRHRDFLDQTLYVDTMTYLPEDILTKVDITSMACSLETRSPFLDHKLVELAASTPIRFKMPWITGKHILREAFRDEIPRPIQRRAKMGFGVPIAEWLRRDLTHLLDEYVVSDRVMKRGCFRKDALERMVDEHRRGVFDHGYRLWALIVLEYWLRMFIDPGSAGVPGNAGVPPANNKHSTLIAGA